MDLIKSKVVHQIILAHGSPIDHYVRGQLIMNNIKTIKHTRWSIILIPHNKQV